jgi:hypothetical protein
MGKFFRRGVTKVRFLPAVANSSAPTAPEIAAGTDITPALAGMSGFQLSNAPIAVPNMQDVFTPQIPGEDTVADSSLEINDDNASSTIRTALAKGTSGFVLLQPYGATSAKRCEVWPVTVTGFNDVYSVDNTPAKSMAGFAVTATPTQNAVNP